MRVNPRQLIAASATLVVLTTVTALAQSSVGQRELRRLGVVGPPDRYTELAFANPAKLPNTLRRVPQTVHIAFTVANHERTTFAYTWRIVVTDVGARIVSMGHVDLSQGQQSYFDPGIRVGCVRRARIAVVLNSGQQINYWATCIGPSAATLRREAAARTRRERARAAGSRRRGSSHPRQRRPPRGKRE